MAKVVDRRKSLSDLISPRKDINRPIYNWHAFKHSYSKELVDTIISEFKIKKGSWILDPFCGGGTTLLACKQAGLNSHGFDMLPFSVFLSNSKINTYNLSSLKKAKELFSSKTVTRQSQTNEFLPDIPLLKKAFSKKIVNELVRIKSIVETIHDSATRDFYNLGFLSILESVSNTSKAGGFLRLVDRNIKPAQVLPLFITKVGNMIINVEQAQVVKHKVSKAFLGDARSIPTKKLYDSIITSPPYPNRHDYTRIYSLEMMFDFVKSNDDLKKIRYESLRSHVEARKKFDVKGYEEPKRLRRLIRRVQENGTNNPQVLSMLAGYFEDMYLVLSEMKQHLNKKGRIALVVSNVRFAGINIPVDEILGEIGEQVGLKNEAIWVARFRGNSAQQMKKYSREPSRESIVIWSH